MAEERNWEETNNHIPCAGNCGFFGNPTSLNICSKCHKLSADKTLSPPPETSFSIVILPLTVAPVVSNSVVMKSQVRNRCGSCNRRVGLTGFTCKCGMTFCGTHRYAEMHGCTFDYKGMGKEAIAKANPVIKGKKLDKI